MSKSLTDPKTTCIVLVTDVKAGDDRRLDLTLEERCWSMTRQTDPLAAMVDAAVREREQASRSGWGLLRNESVCIAIDRYWSELNRQTCEEFINAMRRYLPGVAIWSIDGTDLRPIHATRPVTDSSAATKKQARPVRQQDVPAASEPALDHVTISREEMDMLLETADGGDR